ncbi:hypothetical protein DV452_004796 [Geotrichum candidum]|nr:hypothetical protein DV452_004796 [Geotrichum candidum]
MAQFIGKTITLISNSENRYVGILHEINAQDSTVSLRHVRSYGSEGRRNGINEFPPSDRVFEYIVFRGSDVKDLKISDEPPEPLNQPPPQSQTPVQTPAQPYAGPQQPQRQPAPPGQSAGFGQQAYPGYNSFNQQQPQQSPQQPPQQPVPQQQPSSNASQKSSEVPYPHHPNQDTQYPPSQEDDEASDEEKTEAETPKSSATFISSKNKSPAPVPTQPAASKTKLSEFDFAESNAKFSKEALAQEVANAPPSVIPPAGKKDEFYNKSTSFFDNISSATKERIEGTDNNMTGYQRRGEERKLNLETFGQDSVYTNNRGGRGGRGRGGRGNNNYRGRGNNYRGRGGYNNNYNNGGYNNNNTNNNGGQFGGYNQGFN